MNDKIRAILEKINEDQTQVVSKIEEAKETVIGHQANKVETIANTVIVEEPKTKPVAKTSRVANKPKSIQKALHTEGVGAALEETESAANDSFLANLVNETFSYEKRKYAFIEPRLFELFMQVKMRKDIKNISVIVNTILNEYVEKHQKEIKKLLESKFL